MWPSGSRCVSPTKLQRYLSSFDTQQHAYSLSPTAVDAMLSVARHLALPAWLRSRFEASSLNRHLGTDTRSL